MTSIQTLQAIKRILFIEDSVEYALLIQRWLQQMSGVEVVHVADGLTGAQFAEFGTWDLVISDIELPGMEGLDLIQLAKKANPFTPVFMITAHQKMEYAVKALHNRADALMFKPMEKQAFEEKVYELLEAAQSHKKESQKIVLAIGAHPDDVEIGCGGTLLRHKAAGDQVFILTATGGEVGGHKSLRVKESEAAAALIGAKLFMGDLVDTRVSEGIETIQLIEKVLKEVNPTHLYTHTPNDGHQDHRSVYRATVVAARSVPNVYCYQAPSTNIDFRPTSFIEVSPFIDKKIEAICAYRTQTAIRPYLKEDMIIATARYWGRFSGYGMAEPMEVVKQAQ